MNSKHAALCLVLTLAAAPTFASDLSTRAAVGGGLGGALGGFLGAELGGRNASILGSGLGAAAGSAVATQGYERPYRREVVVHEYRRPHGHSKKRHHREDYDD